MTKTEIINRIIEKTRTNYARWTIGVTGDPLLKRAGLLGEKLDISYWAQWQTDSIEDSTEIMLYFRSKGFKVMDTDEKKAGYVFIF